VALVILHAMKFRGTILLGGKTATGVEVPDHLVAALGSKRPAVRVTIGDHSYRTSIASMGGRFMLPISAEVRQATGVAAGDEVDVELSLDTEPRVVNVPDDLAAALAADSSAGAFFASLSYSNRLRHVLAIEAAKTPETRQRRIDKTVSTMGEGRA
jgi:hypothetical protein